MRSRCGLGAVWVRSRCGLGAASVRSQCGLGVVLVPQHYSRSNILENIILVVNLIILVEKLYKFDRQILELYHKKK